MKQVYSVTDLRDCLAGERPENKRVGFVPTMGALHDGHLSLVKRCIEENDVCVASIFVNPTQFNNKADLETYPRMPEKDCALLETAGCDYLFTPSEKEMYPEPDTRVFDFGPLAQVMEGAFRPGHFNGVAQIVSKLFDAVGPCRAYFGEKDFQQVAIIRWMVEQLNIPVQIVACPILREADGLAMSSRNMRLTRLQRQKAPLIYQTLKESTGFAPDKTVRETEVFVADRLNSEPLLLVEYFDIVDGYTLSPIRDWKETPYPVGCIAVYCGEVRLIDNITYKI
ncbi:MAG: pantoate--beta-alanine ligase [Tannerellaceae bacterium]|jgi:pantoate--beta-alanine ligase|nr:pantoate--beta-alanine ligase [Tannerellaceae bacterium]